MGDEIEVLAAFVHGALAFGHTLGLIFNLRRARRLDLDGVVHASALVYDVMATWKHAKRARR